MRTGDGEGNGEKRGEKGEGDNRGKEMRGLSNAGVRERGEIKGEGQREEEDNGKDNSGIVKWMGRKSTRKK